MSYCCCCNEIQNGDMSLLKSPHLIKHFGRFYFSPDNYLSEINTVQNAFLLTLTLARAEGGGGSFSWSKILTPRPIPKQLCTTVPR